MSQAAESHKEVMCVFICCVWLPPQFVSRSLDDVNNEEWLMAVGTAMGERDLVVERYTNYPEEKVWRHDSPTPLPTPPHPCLRGEVTPTCI